MLELAAEGVLIGETVAQPYEDRTRAVGLPAVPMLVDEGSEENRIGREGVPEAKSVRGGLNVLLEVWPEVIGEEVELEIAFLGPAIPELELRARLPGRCQLDESIGDAVLLVDRKSVV